MPFRKQEQSQLLLSNAEILHMVILPSLICLLTVIFETLGVMCPGMATFLKDLSSRLKHVTEDD